MAKCPRTKEECPYWTESEFGIPPYCALEEFDREPCPNPKAYTFVQVSSYTPSQD